MGKVTVTFTIKEAWALIFVAGNSLDIRENAMDLFAGDKREANAAHRAMKKLEDAWRVEYRRTR